MDITQKLAQEVARKLTAIKAQFKIIMPDGTELGDLQVVPPKKKRSAKVPRGTYSNIFKPVISNIGIGDVKTFDAAEYGVESKAFASAISAGMCQMYGNESHAIHFNKETKLIELIRLK